MPSRECCQGSINLAGKEVTYTVRISSRAKNVRLQVGTDSGLQVIVPGGFDPGNLENIIREKQHWVLDKLDYLSRLSCDRRQDNRSVLYQGREYALETSIAAGAAYNVAVENGKIIVTMPEGAKVNAGYVLEQWFRYLARKFIHERIGVLNQKLNLSFNKVFVKDQKTRWGSCSGQKNLNFNWRLIMAPAPVLDYVIVHELMHLLEPNHSKRFWALVAEACPDYKEHRAWLRENGRRLVL